MIDTSLAGVQKEESKYKTFPHPKLFIPEDYRFELPGVAERTLTVVQEDGSRSVSPDVVRKILTQRAQRLHTLRSLPDKEREAEFTKLKLYYKAAPIQFIIDWGLTSDTRNVGSETPTLLPLIPWPRQIQLLQFYLDMFHGKRDGLVPKSRDQGASILALALAVTLCLFNERLTLGFLSNNLDNVDVIGDDQSLLEKARDFIELLPEEFRAGFRRDERDTSKRKLIRFPMTHSRIKGVGGKNPGRGGRARAFWVDESAHLEYPELVDNALSANTPCRIDVSSVNGVANAFAQKILEGKLPTFYFHYRDDPRKTPAWKEKEQEKRGLLSWAQEYEIDIAASADGIIIPSEWVRAAVGFAKEHNIPVEGITLVSYDVADRGNDLNALSLRKGIQVEDLKLWTGKKSDLFASATEAFNWCDKHGSEIMIYDSVAIGGGTFAASKNINEARTKSLQEPIRCIPFNGGSSVVHPDRRVPGMGKKRNKEHYANLKAQGWGYLAYRFEQTYKATKGQPYDPNYLISINENIEPDLLSQLINELSQPTQEPNGSGKLVVNKVPNGTRSPNLADSVMQAFSPIPMPLVIPREYL